MNTIKLTKGMAGTVDNVLLGQCTSCSAEGNIRVQGAAGGGIKMARRSSDVQIGNDIPPWTDTILLLLAMARLGAFEACWWLW